ncbi:MAG: SCO family protein [Solirubrobacteraceae bacterium]
MAPRLRLALVVTAILALATIAAVLAFAVGEKTATGAAFQGATRPPSIPPAALDLPDERGKLVRMSALRGTPVVVTFLYTTCKDSCPLTTDQIRSALDELGHDVPVIAVSVDPDNDTPRRARSFSFQRKMTGRMRWLLGDRGRLQRIWRAFGIQPQGDDQEHTASTVLLDAQGRQRVGFSNDVLTPEGLAHDIALLEAEKRGS